MASHEMQSSPSRDKSPNAKSADPDIDFLERAGEGASYGDSVSARISKSHRDFLLERHGTLEGLDPIPSPSPSDPYNWPEWKVRKMRNPLAMCTRERYAKRESKELTPLAW